jgi:hypothetical protein
MTAPEGAKICAVCLHTLDFYEDRSDPEDAGRYVHAREEFMGPRTHVAIPVEPDEVSGIAKLCDFCYADTDVNWTVVTHPFTMTTVVLADPTLEQGQSFSALWAACEECADLVRRKRWSALRSRALESVISRHPGWDAPGPRRFQKALILALYSRVEANYVTVRESAFSDYADDSHSE